MSFSRWFLFLILIQLSLVSGVSFIDNFKYIYDQFFSRCTEKYLRRDVAGLKSDLLRNLFGQPLVIDVVVSALKGHLSKYHPTKPLALSFHGWTGSGKNYVCDHIVRNLFEEEHESPYVHIFSAKIHFPLKSYVHQYQIDLKNKIIDSVTSCPYSMFIFDEVDKYPEGVLDVVKPFLDYKVTIDGVDYRKAVFIFLSNLGSNAIVERTLQLWKSGVRRDDFRLRDFEQLLTIESFNGEGGFYNSDLIEGHVIDFFVPFLPLEEEHVRLCADAELKKLNIYSRPDIVEEVIKDMVFAPEPENLFSSSGCKRVSERVAYYAMWSRRKNKQEL